MGAQLAFGTTVMLKGAAYINFNAGTLGTVMVEEESLQVQLLSWF